MNKRLRADAARVPQGAKYKKKYEKNLRTHIFYVLLFLVREGCFFEFRGFHRKIQVVISTAVILFNEVGILHLIQSLGHGQYHAFQ